MSRTLLVLLALTLLAGFLRLRGNDYLLPLLVEPDPHCAVQVRMIEAGMDEPQADPNWGKYPHLIAWATIVWSDPAPTPERDAGLDAHLEAAKDPVHRVRTIVGLLGLLAVPATWLLARRFMGDGWALLAAGLMATSLLACHFGAQARPHGAAVTFIVLALWGWTRVAQRGTLGDYLLASLLGALAVGTLQSGVALGFPVLTAHLISARRRGGSAWLLGGRRAAWLLIPAACLALAFYLTWPFLFTESVGRDGAQFEVQGKELNQAGHKLMLGLFNGRGFGILAAKLFTWEPALVLGLGLALVGLVFGRRVVPTAGGGRAVVWSYLLPYLLVAGMYERVYERFLLPILPLVAIAAAWGVARLVARWPRRELAWALALVLLAPPMVVAGKLTLLRTRPPTQDLAQAWLTEHAQSGDRVLVSRPLQLPLFKSAVSRIEELGNTPVRPSHVRLDWDRYQGGVFDRDRPSNAWQLVWIPQLPMSMEDLKQLRREPGAYVERQFGDWLVAEIFAEGRVEPGLTATHQVFRRRAPGGVLARFSPDGAGRGTGHPLSFQDEVPANGRVHAPWMAWRVLLAERMGPAIEILRPPHRKPPNKRQ